MHMQPATYNPLPLQVVSQTQGLDPRPVGMNLAVLAS